MSLAQAVFEQEAVEGGGQAREDASELEPVLAAAFFAGEFPQLGDQGDGALVESRETLVGSELANRFRWGSGAAEPGDGGGKAARVLGEEFDDFAVEVERAVMDGGGKGAVSVRGNAGQLSDLEVGGAELFPQADDLVRVSAIDSEVRGTEFAPARGDELKPVRLAQTVEAGGLGRGAAASHQAEGVALAENRTQVQRGG